MTLAEQWDVDEAQLKATWRRMMALTHPDRMGDRSKREQQIAEQQSALVNKAYETLRKPLSRAVYLLEMHAGSSISEADRLDDSALLMAVLEAREALEDAQTEPDVTALRQENAERLAQTVHKIGVRFRERDGATDWAALKKLTIELRYWSNIDDACREWQPGKPVMLQH
ncbi:Co-chaperone Hsc20 [Tilletiaria anomala UBC 951]|uniref:Co-chaperone Hsc20 n=1 Tax=Tilletiaria anomala (strain ATCC 24038 / CBS 436.72 / UBC 951) TaxID=1037660 RepID=A0A066VVQ6_TILAU|nr:Co-chaperone Hsc20 [Tilletiaria anomala UBC 951]KDN42869.1 Co-chaperone Hsc20 [Tilletiaria anomala UBC 951]